MRNPGLRKRNILPAVLAFSLLLSPAPDADAAGVVLDFIPTLRLEEGYNSNVYDSTHDEVGSFGTRLTPGLALRLTAPDDVKLQLSGFYNWTWYHDSDAEDANDKNWNLRVETSGAWKFTPSFSMTPSAYYVRSPDYFSRSQSLPSGDPTLPPVSIINHGNVDTDEFGGGLKFEYAPSPNWTIGVTGYYSRQEFPDDNTASGLADGTQVGGALSVNYTVSPRSRLGVVASTTHHTYETSESTDSYFLGIQFGYQFTPMLRLDMTVGASLLREGEEGGVDEQTDTSPSGSFNLSYRTETTIARFFGSALYTGASGYDEASREITAGVGFTNHLTREWSWSIEAVYQNTESVFDENSVNIDSFTGRVGLEYRPLEWLAINGRIIADWQESEGLQGDTIESYAAILGFTLGKSLNIY